MHSTKRLKFSTRTHYLHIPVDSSRSAFIVVAVFYEVNLDNCSPNLLHSSAVGKSRLLQRAESHLATLQRRVTAARSMRRGDIFEIAEDIVLPVLGVVYDLPNLENLNYTEGANFPSIDLGDKKEREAFQITSKVSTGKVESTLDKFFDHGLNAQYDKIRFLGLYEKQNSYPKERIAEHVKAGLDFDPERDIEDLTDLAERISGLRTPDLSKVVHTLDDEIEGGYVVDPRISSRDKGEFLLANLVEVDPPPYVYTAKISIDRDKLIESTWDSDDVRGLDKDASWKSVIRKSLRLDDKEPVSDFITHSGELATFRDIRNADQPLSDVVYPDSISRIPTEDFHKKNPDRERRFKFLLDSSISEILHHSGVSQHYDENEYIFLPDDENQKREESWTSIEESRGVYFPRYDDKDEFICGKHLAFETSYYIFNNMYYLSITPDWYWSYDGYFGVFSSIGDKRDYIKNEENNNDVKNHFKFIEEYIKRKVSEYKREEPISYIYPKVGEGLGVGPTPKLKDEVWLKRIEEVRKDKDEEIDLFTQ